MMRLPYAQLLGAMLLAALGFALFAVGPRSTSYANVTPGETGHSTSAALFQGLTAPSVLPTGAGVIDQTGPYGPATGPATGTTSGQTGPSTGETGGGGPTTTAPDDCWLYDSFCSYCTQYAGSSVCMAYPPGHRSNVATPMQPSRSATPTAGASGSNPQRMLGNIAYNDRGTADATGKATQAVTVDSFSFAPTFIQGAAGQSLKLTLQSHSSALHNFTLSSQQINTDIPANGSVDVTVTFPMSGVVRFYCKYHTTQGMNGELLVGSAMPQAAP